MKKRLALMLCVLAVLLVFPGVALADDDGPQPQAPHTFRIVGYTTSYDYHTLPSGRTRFHLTAEGDGSTPTLNYGTSGVTGAFTGSFSFDEWGIVDFNPETGQGSGRGINSGIMTIVEDDGDKVVVAFRGRSTFQTVSGRFRVLDGTGGYDDFHGWGTYNGVPDLCWDFPPGPTTCTGFYVDFTFTCSFYADSD